MAVDYLLKFADAAGIKGESEEGGHVGEIQLLSWSLGGNMSTSVDSGGGSSAGKASFSELSFMKMTDKATPAIFKAMVSGTHIAQADLFSLKMAKGEKKVFKQLTFKEVFITTFQSSASSEIPSESVSFSFGSVQLKYWNQDKEGTLTEGGDHTYEIKTGKVS